MTGQIETADVDQKATRWQTLRRWLTAIDEGMNYDPQEHTDATLRHLREEVARLETRLIDLEGHKERAA